MKYIIIALILTTCISYSLDTLWTHSRGLHGASIDKAEFTPDESIIVLSSDHGIKAVTTETGETIWSKKVEYINSMTKISEQFTLMFTGYFDPEGNSDLMRTFLVDVNTGQIIDSLFKIGDWASSNYLSKDGSLFTKFFFQENDPNSNQDDQRSTQIFDLNGNVIFDEEIHEKYYKHIITPDNKYLLAYGGYEDLYGVKKYNIETGELEHHFNPIDTLFDYVEISEDSKYLFCSNKVDTIYLFDLETNELLFTFFEKDIYNWGEDFYYNELLQKFCFYLIKDLQSGIPTSNFSVYDINSGAKEFTVVKNPEDLTGIVAINNKYILANGVGENLRLLSMIWEPTSVENLNDYLLSINPNPASEFLFINYLIEEPSNIILSINDIAGNQLQIIDDGFKTPNNYEINYNLNNIPSGTYFITLQINDNVLTKQIIKE